MNLLCLIRFVPGHTGQQSAVAGCDRFEACLAAIGGATIHREGLQLLVRFQDINSALKLLSDALENAVDQGHAISAGLAQGIRSSATVATSLSGFTEGSIGALFEIAAAAGRQQVAISQKLSSFVQLGAPEFESRFQPASPGEAGARIRMPLVMTPLPRGRSSGKP